MNTEAPSVPARLFIVDDHAIVRLGIRQMINDEPNLLVCGEAETAHTAVEQVRLVQPDLAIVDLSLEDGHGLDLIRTLRDVKSDLLVLVLSIHDEALFAARAIRAGAHGYIMKQEAIGRLVHAIREVLAGRVYVSERLSETVPERHVEAESSPNRHLGRLTDRELEVLELIGRGVGTSAIAARLNVSVKTIETYRQNIKTKLNLQGASDLTRYAIFWLEHF